MKNLATRVTQGLFGNVLKRSISGHISYKSQTKSLFKQASRYFSGCADHACGCSSKKENNSVEEDIEKKMKAMNYKIIQCINMAKYEDALDLSDDYISEVKSYYGIPPLTNRRRASFLLFSC